jgi:CRISPR-associated protein Cas1
MAVVYLADQGASISKRGDRLYVYKGTLLLRWFHTKDISQLIIVGNIAMTAQALTFLLINKIDTVFLTYYGKFKGRLVGEFGKNVSLRIAQFDFLSSLENRQDLASSYIIGKISNMQCHLAKRGKRNKHPLISDALIKNAAIMEKLSLGVNDLNILRGYEGITAKNYFAAFPAFIYSPEFPFTGRNRRPPKDEVNALLSLGYTFLMNQIMTATYIVGLDPYYGALHDIAYGRQSLVLDIMEEFRPLVDNLIISIINRKEIRIEHFSYNQLPNDECEPDELDTNSRLLPVSMKPEGMKILITAFAKMINTKYTSLAPSGEWTLKDIFLNQARHLANHFEHKEQYRSFLWQ